MKQEKVSTLRTIMNLRYQHNHIRIYVTTAFGLREHPLGSVMNDGFSLRVCKRGKSTLESFFSRHLQVAIITYILQNLESGTAGTKTHLKWGLVSSGVIRNTASKLHITKTQIRQTINYHLVIINRKTPAKLTTLVQKQNDLYLNKSMER